MKEIENKTLKILILWVLRVCYGEALYRIRHRAWAAMDPHGPTKGRKEKKKQGERNWVGGRGAEYESEEEERVRWLFIGISEVGAVKVWSCPWHFAI